LIIVFPEQKECQLQILSSIFHPFNPLMGRYFAVKGVVKSFKSPSAPHDEK